MQVFVEAVQLGWLLLPGRYARAQSTVEYGLVGALVILVAAAALTGLGNELSTVFSNLTAQLGKR